MDNKLEIIKIFDQLTYQETVFLCDNSFTSNELEIFSIEDRLKIWEPNGEPFFGNFDLYIKVFKKNEFKGFFRIEVFPWGELNLHIAFPTSDSFISRYYLKITHEFLKSLIPLSKKLEIYCVFRTSNTNVLRYMRHFKFSVEKTTHELIYFKFNIEYL